MNHKKTSVDKEYDKYKLNKLNLQKELLKNKYKCHPTQSNLFNILNTIKQIKILEKTFQIE